jgi:hypothetical protein
MCYTFDVAKCDRILNYLLQEKQIKLSSNHVIQSSKQLKKHAYYKWHNSYSYATNDCNVFCRQVQSAINEGQLKFVENPQMKLEGKRVLVQPSQSESIKGKEVVIGEERPPRMIKPKSPKDGQWQKKRRVQAAATHKGHIRHLHGQVQGTQGRHQGS